MTHNCIFATQTSAELQAWYTTAYSISPFGDDRDLNLLCPKWSSQFLSTPSHKRTAPVGYLFSVMTTPSFQLLKVDRSVTLDSLSTLNLSKNLIGYKEAIKKTLYPESSPLPCHFHSYYPDSGSWITLAGSPYQPPEGSLCSCPSLLEGHRDPLRHQSHHHDPLPRLCSDHLLLYND